MHNNDTRLKVLALYGNKCARCGYCENLAALQVDHKISFAVRNIKRPKHESGTILYNAILNGTANKDDYQVLCANCHCIKRKENDEYKNTHLRAEKKRDKQIQWFIFSKDELTQLLVNAAKGPQK
jgi:hypothetical protein